MKARTSKKDKRASHPRVLYGQAVYGKEEVEAVVDVLRDPLHIGPGKKVREFEYAVAKRFGKKHGVLVNSGSSANLLALDVLQLPAGAEIITPALTFGTTLAPILQHNLKPVFVDVAPATYVIDPEKIEALITKKTRALMIPLLLGNVPNMARLATIARKHHLYLIEDSCDTVGATFGGKPTGRYSDISTTSFYASHIITAAGSGGMVMSNNAAMARRLLVISSWGRESTLFGSHEKSEDIHKRFGGRLGALPYDAKFIFSEIGYNLQSSELNAAFGLMQLKRLVRFKRVRERNFARLQRFFKRYEHLFELPLQHPRVRTAWLCFPLTIRKDAPFSRIALTRFLEEHNIQTRPVFTGNVLRQPAFRHLAHPGRSFPVADAVMERGLVLGCHQGLGAQHLAHVERIVTDFISRYG